MSTTITSTKKCSKRPGEYCRLHNPAPVKKSFSSVQDVFQKISEQANKRKNISQKKQVQPGTSFQNVQETRYLPEGVPQDINEHIELSKEALSHLTDEERLALKGYTSFAAGVCNTVLHGQEYEYYDDAPLWKESDGPCDFVSREDLVNYMEAMDTILENRQTESRIVYRGIPIFKSLHDEIGASIGRNLHPTDTKGLMAGLQEYYKPGKVFNNPTYLSTSLSAYQAASRTDKLGQTKSGYSTDKPEIMGIQFEMKTNAGLDVTGISNGASHEREIVLPRDTHFKVVNVIVKPKMYDTVSGHDNEFDKKKRYEASFKKLAVVVQMVEVDSEGNEITHTKPHKPKPSIEDVVPR